jgi:hypothetical protein
MPDDHEIAGRLRRSFDELTAAIATAESNVLEGRCKDFGDLQKHLGERAGLKRAERIFRERMFGETKAPAQHSAGLRQSTRTPPT